MDGAGGKAWVAGLDGWRAIALLFLFLYTVRVVNTGWVAVWIVFQISGFLITRELLAREGSLLCYYQRRARRILPGLYLYLAVVGAGAGVLWLHGSRLKVVGDTLAGLPWLASLSYNLYSATAHFWVDHLNTESEVLLWSLAFLAQMWLVWPLVMRLRGRALWAALIAIIVAASAFRIYCAATLPSFGPGVWTATYMPFGHMDAFALGGVLALLEAKGKLPPAGLSFALAILMLGVLMGAYQLATHYAGWSQPLFENNSHEGYQYVWEYWLMDAFVFAALAATISGAKPLVPLLETAPLKWLGARSFSIYLWFPVLVLGAEHAGQALGAREHAIPEPVVELAISVVAFMAACAIGWASDKLWERRFRASATPR